MGRGVTVPRWYRNMCCMNLPDSHAGYAVLTVENGSLRIETNTVIGRQIV